MSHKQLTNDPREFPAWLRKRAEGHAPEFDITVYARPAIWLALADAIEACALSPPEPTSPDLLAVLKAVEQRLNESGTGEMGLLDTIHAVYALVKPAIAKAESRAMPLQEDAVTQDKRADE